MNFLVQGLFCAINFAAAVFVIWLLAPFVEQGEALRFILGGSVAVAAAPFATFSLFRIFGLFSRGESEPKTDHGGEDARKAEPGHQIQGGKGPCIQRNLDGPRMPNKYKSDEQIKKSSSNQWAVDRFSVAPGHSDLLLPLSGGEYALLSGIREAEPVEVRR